MQLATVVGKNKYHNVNTKRKTQSQNPQQYTTITRNLKNHKTHNINTKLEIESQNPQHKAKLKTESQNSQH